MCECEKNCFVFSDTLPPTVYFGLYIAFCAPALPQHPRPRAFFSFPTSFLHCERRWTAANWLEFLFFLSPLAKVHPQKNINWTCSLWNDKQVCPCSLHPRSGAIGFVVAVFRDLRHGDGQRYMKRFDLFYLGADFVGKSKSSPYVYLIVPKQSTRDLSSL